MYLFRIFEGELVEFLVVFAIVVLIAFLVRQFFLSHGTRQGRPPAPGEEANEDQDALLRRMADLAERMDRRIANLETILTEKEARKK